MNEGDARGAADAAPRPDPLRLVEAAVSGDDLPRVVASAGAAIGLPVAISLPALDLWAQSDDNFTAEQIDLAKRFAAELIGSVNVEPPDELADAAPVRLAGDTVGVVVAFRAGSEANGEDQSETTRLELRQWLEAAAAAAAVNALMRDSTGETALGARRAFLQLLQTSSVATIDSVLSGASRLGYDFTAGAIAICAKSPNDSPLTLGESAELGIISEVGDNRFVGLVPISSETCEEDAERIVHILGKQGATVIASSPRRGAIGVSEALREAAVLLELSIDSAATFEPQRETYRLLVGVLIRDGDELVALKDNTIAELERYDAAHDTDLLVTLETFLNRHGSTTDTAETMTLHRHTVGYRLARVQEVSGLSPYESEGRERLSLGLKAHRIILADQRRSQRLGRGSAV